MCDKIISDEAFKLKYCHDIYLPALKFVPD